LIAICAQTRADEQRGGDADCEHHLVAGRAYTVYGVAFGGSTVQYLIDLGLYYPVFVPSTRFSQAFGTMPPGLCYVETVTPGERFGIVSGAMFADEYFYDRLTDGEDLDTLETWRQFKRYVDGWELACTGVGLNGDISMPAPAECANES
jgi:hypothetical protein